MGEVEKWLRAQNEFLKRELRERNETIKSLQANLAAYAHEHLSRVTTQEVARKEAA
jgi:hypothetical protein